MPEISCDLSRCFLCTHCLPEWKELIAIRKRTIAIKKGKILFAAGDPVTGIYFVYSGALKISMPWSGGKELLLRFATPGTIAGYRAWGDEQYPVSAVALEDSRVCYIPNELFETLLRTNPSFSYSMLQVYADALQKAERRMRDLAHMDVKGRIALTLLELHQSFGAEDGTIPVPVSRQDIAAYAGTRYETVFKFLSELIAQKIISANGKQLRLHSEKKLRRFTEEHAN